jgi:hypothetical protein
MQLETLSQIDCSVRSSFDLRTILTFMTCLENIEEMVLRRNRLSSSLSDFNVSIPFGFQQRDDLFVNGILGPHIRVATAR